VDPERSRRQVGVEDGNLVLDLFVLHQRIGALLEQALRGTGVRPAEYAVYSQLGIDAMTPRLLSDRLGVTASTLTGHLAAIERRGHLRRDTDPDDRRSHLLTLTASGRATLEACRTRFRAAVEALYAGLDVDVDQARAILRDIDRAAEEAVRDL
jgi:DNA-binding MarR family transcriptional regulator